jgi:hypothetical protein
MFYKPAALVIAKVFMFCFSAKTGVGIVFAVLNLGDKNELIYVVSLC